MTTEVIKLRERMAEIATEARKELDKITDKTTAEQSKEIEGRFDVMMADHDAISSRVERMSRLGDAESALEAVQNRAPMGENTEARGITESVTPEYKEVFEKQLRFGTASLGREEREVLLTGRAESRAQSVGTDSAGGYTVPEGFSGEVDKAMAVWGPMWDASIVRELSTTTGNRIPWPTIDDTANTGRIKAENAAADDDGTDDATFGEKQLDAFVYDTGIVRMSMEILQDSAFNMESLLNELFAERLGRTANAVLTTGTGSGQPNGILTASGLGTTAAGTGSVTGDEIIDLIHSVDAAYRSSPKTRFMFNDTTLAAIRKLKDGDGNYLWQMGDIRVGEPSSIFGYAYSVNQAMPDLGTGNKPMLFGDLSRYIVRKVDGFSVMTLRERYAENFQVGMVGHKRFDGELLNAGAVKHLINS